MTTVHTRGRAAVVLVLAALTLTGCYAADYKTDSFTAPPAALSDTATAYVAVPDDGRYGDQIYAGSGNETALAIVAAVSMHGRAILGIGRQTHETDLAKAKEAKASYLFEPLILHWEHRATEWSGKPNRITLRIEIYETADDRILADTVLESHSSWWTLGGDRPQDLLPKTIKPFIDRVYGSVPQ